MEFVPGKDPSFPLLMQLRGELHDFAEYATRLNSQLQITTDAFLMIIFIPTVISCCFVIALFLKLTTLRQQRVPVDYSMMKQYKEGTERNRQYQSRHEGVSVTTMLKSVIKICCFYIFILNCCRSRRYKWLNNIDVDGEEDGLSGSFNRHPEGQYILHRPGIGDEEEVLEIEPLFKLQNECHSPCYDNDVLACNPNVHYSVANEETELFSQ